MAKENQKQYWEGKAFSFFAHKDCEYYPCHPVPEGMEFNCLFCYCPLYALGDQCGGAFRYTDQGRKDCTRCTFPHRRENYGKVNARYEDIAKLAAQNRETGEK